VLGDYILTPVVIFFIALLVVGILFALGRSKSDPSEDKSMPYACGENVPALRSPVQINLFDFVVAFLVFDVIAIMLVFSFDASDVLLPLIYLGLAGVALTALPVYRRRP
jgi:NADH:ubiquinone oxidoreductase subunit 3 (subunit A)